MAALTAIVIRLAFGQLHRTGGLPTIIGIVPIVWFENHDRAPRYVDWRLKLTGYCAECNARTDIAPRPHHEFRRACLPSWLVPVSGLPGIIDYEFR